MSANNVESQYLGLIEFDKALELQHQYHAQVSLENKSYILGLEHPTVMTLGLRAHKLALSDICSLPIDYPVHKISRGGLATIHNPGQLVVYPIVNLKKQGLSVKGFVESLFLATQKTLSELGIESTIDLCDQPGVYTSKGKIAFCGLQIKNGITLHGLSINISNDISLFAGIQSCGVSGPKIDSVAKHGVTYSPQDFYKIWLKHFNLESGVKLSNTSCNT
ncbi:lipoyl(octanoyl) transferase [Bdellovibrio sp. qaytius]|nr:lipoyl(octanoyl) transferase [Bdellovibrio sp. qaytius]